MEENQTSTILIVEDERAMRQALEMLLVDEGYRAVSASSGSEALTKAAEVIPDLVLLDVKMPEVDGFEVCRRMRADPLLAQVPIIMLTAVVDRDSRLRGFEAGADDFVTKPFDEIELLARVRTTTRLNRYRRLLEEQARRQKVEQELQESERFLESIFDAIQDGISVRDRELNITHVNRWMKEKYTSKMPLLGKKCYEAFQERQTPCPWCPAIPAMETGGPQRGVVVPYPSAQDPTGWLELSVFPLRDAEGRIVGAIEHSKDITERVRSEQERERAAEALRESEERFYSLFETMVEGVALHEVICDEHNEPVDYVILAANPAYESHTGIRPEDAVGRRAASLYGADEPPYLDIYAQVAATGEPTQFETYFESMDRHFRISVFSPDEGQFATVFEDISERKRAEESIRQHTRELEALNEVAQAIASTLDLEEVLTLVTEHATGLMDMAATSVVLRDEARDDLYFAAASGEGASVIVGLRLEMGQGIAGWVAQQNEPALIPDVSEDPRWYEGFDEEIDFTTQSVLCVPLRSKSRTIGALEAINKKGGFTQKDLDLLSALAAQAAVAIENVRLFQEVQHGHEQLQTLSHRLVEVQEAERAYVARELHDETAQALSSLLLNLSLLEKNNACPEPVIEQVVQMENMVDQMLENLHRLSVSLHPAALSHLGLPAALEQYVETFNQQYGLETALEVVGLEDERLPAEMETALYRIVQEAMTNVARHAHATHVDVLVERRGDQVVTIIEDDGSGFDPEEAMASSRLGLLGMHERAEMLNGSLTIESIIGTGTTVFVEVPYDKSDGSA